MSETRIAEHAQHNGHATDSDGDGQRPLPERIIAGLAEQITSRIPPADLDERDPDYIRENLPRQWLLASLWFRGEVRGLGNIPEEGPVLMVGNHSGGNLTPDTIVFTLAYSAYFGVERAFYQLAHNLVLSMPGLSTLRKYGTVAAGHDNASKALDSGAGSVVFEQAGYIHELDPRSGKEHVVSITAAGDFPWMMPNWEDVTNRMTNMALSPTGKRVVVEARGEIFTIPAEKGDVRNLTNSSGSAERDPAWSPDGKFISYFSDKSGEYRLYIEAQDGLTPPREIVLQNPTHYYTSSWSPDSKKIVFSDTNLRVWVIDAASGQAKGVGNSPWMVPNRTLDPVWSPDSKWVAYASRLRSMYHAIFVSNVETGETKQVTDGLADAVSPAWDASGKYLWFLASTDFGLRSQWLDMTSYDHDENFGLYVAVLKKTDTSPLLPESDEDKGVGTGRRAPAPGACPSDAAGGSLFGLRPKHPNNSNT